jgi:hypothetical protein
MAFPNTKFLGGSVISGQAVAPDPEYFDDFIEGGYGTSVAYKFSSTANKGAWLYTELGGATSTFIISDAELGGVMTISDAGTTNHGSNSQLNGESFVITADKDIYWEMRWKPSHATALDFVIGLVNTSTAVIAGTITDAIVFRSGAVDTSPDNAGVADIIASTANGVTSWTHANITEVDTGVNMVADTWVTTAFHLHMADTTANSRLHFYVNGNEKLVTSSNIPDIGTALTPTIARQNNVSAANLEVDYIYCAQKR